MTTPTSRSTARRLGGAAWLCSSLALAPGRLPAQGAVAALSVSGGVATDARGIRSRAASVAPALTLLSETGSLAVGGRGTAFDVGGWALDGSLRAGSRTRLGGRAAFTLDAGAGGTLTSFEARFLTAELLPAVEARLGALTAFVGARGAVGRTSSLVAGESGGPFGLPGAAGTSRVSVQRHGAGALAGLVVALSRTPGVASLRLVGERTAIADTLVDEATAALSLARGPLTVALGGGARTTAGDGTTGFGSVTLAARLARGASLELSAGSYPANRLLGTAAGRYLAAGISLQSIRRTAGAPEGSRPAVRVQASPPARGRTRLAIRAAGASRVEVAGSWNDWKPLPARRAPDGVWFADLPIPPGRHRYAFRVDGTQWRVPDGADAVDDEFGGRSAWLTVTGP